MKGMKRIFAMLMALTVMLTVLPVSAYSGLALDGPCPNHPAHDAGCGYVEGESPCLHICEQCATPERLHELDSTLDEEIAALEEAYFGDGPAELTPEYQQALMSLYSTLSENGGMTVSLPKSNAAQTGITTEQTLPDGVVLDPELKINLPYGVEGVTVANGTDVTLRFGLNKAVDYEVSLRLRVLEGSAREGVNYALSGSTASGDDVLRSAETTITFPPGTQYVTKKLDILNDTSKGTGTRYLVLLYDNPSYATFWGLGANQYSLYSPIAINMNNAYDLSLFNTTKNAISGDMNTSTAPWNAYQYAVTRDNTEYWRIQGEESWTNGKNGDGEGDAISSNSWHVLTEDAQALIRDGIANRMVFNLLINYDRSGDNWCWSHIQRYRWYNDSGNLLDAIYYNEDCEKLNSLLPPKAGQTGVPYSGEGEYSGSHTVDLTSNDWNIQLFLGQYGYVWNNIFNMQYEYVPSTEIQTYLIDDKAPTFVGFHVPAGTYGSGDVIPITAEFSEPVTGNITLNLVDGSALQQLEAANVQTKYRTYLYTVQDRNNTVITVRSLTPSNTRDLNGNAFSGWTAPNSSQTLPGVTIVTPMEKRAFADGTGSMTAVYPKRADGAGSWDSYIRTDTGRVEIKLNYNSNTALDLTNWLASEYSSTGKLSRVKLSLDSGRSFYDVVYATDEAGDAMVDTLVCEFPVSDLEVGTHQATLWMADQATGSGPLVFYPVLNGTAAVKVSQADVTGIDLSAVYGGGDTPILPEETGEVPVVLLSDLVGDGTTMPPIKFTADLTPDRVSYPSVTWKVENTDPSIESPIAEITQDPDDPLLAQLTLTGNAFGQVTVTATADNGGGSADPVEETFTFEVVRDISLFVGNAVSVKVGAGGVIRWMNSDGDIYEDSVYTVELYEADDNGEPVGEPIETYVSEPGASSVEAEDGTFTEISSFDGEKGAYRPAYVAVITTPDLYNIGKTLEERAEITVYPDQVSVS